MDTNDDTAELDSDLSSPPARRDPLDAVLARAVAAPAAYPMLAPGATVGRYVIDRVLGVGGMGTVYLARDPQLDRAVALKLHRMPGASDRMLREAIAMARLAHPNVVTVYEVGELDGRAFVAMEYVPGATLRGWIAAAPRRRRELLAAACAAGEGLAAAHAAGLIHRDVKPDNIFVGDDGRVRIGDFGLAQLPRSEVRGVRLDVPIDAGTATGTVVGTPAYMAPEQIEGGELDARTDQFAFCVAVWEMLAGERPFRGATTTDLRDAIRAGQLRPTRRIPLRLRRVLARGLAGEPGDRWPSLPALLRALRAAERRPRILAGAAVAGALAGALVGWLAWPAVDPAAGCADAGAEIELVLPDALIDAAADAAQRGNGANAATAAGLVRSSSRQFRTSYRELATASCRARATGHWDARLLAASRECTAYTGRLARELLIAAPRAATQPSDVLQLVNRYPQLAPCGDARFLAGWRPLAQDPAMLEAVIAASAQLDAVKYLLELGDPAAARAARALVASTAAAPTHADPAVAMRLDLVRAAVAIVDHDLAGAEALLTDVYYRARSRDDAPLALQAVADLISVVGHTRRDYPAAARWIQDGIAEAERGKWSAPTAAFAVFATAAAVESDAGEHQRALAIAAYADQLTADPDTRIELLVVRATAYAGIGQLDRALSELADATARATALIGAQHPRIAELAALRATLLLDAGRLQEAAVAGREAVAILDGAGDDQSDAVATAAMNLGAALLQNNDPAAETYLEKARAIWLASRGADHADIALVDSNLALLLVDRGELPRALGMLRDATKIQERTLGANHEELAAGLYNLAVVERQSGQLAAALATSERCAAIYGARQPGSDRHANALIHTALIHNLLGQHAEALARAAAAIALPIAAQDDQAGAWSRLEAARALIALRGDREQARTWLREARTRYEKVNLPQRLTEIDGMLAALR